MKAGFFLFVTGWNPAFLLFLEGRDLAFFIIELLRTCFSFMQKNAATSHTIYITIGSTAFLF